VKPLEKNVNKTDLLSGRKVLYCNGNQCLTGKFEGEETYLTLEIADGGL